MEQAGVERKLAAIVSADVVGFGKLMRADETGTLATLNEQRAETVDPEIARHHGRIVKTSGDGLLVEFASVVDALQCAVSVQEHIRIRNETVPPDRRLEWRIGVHLGDVIVQDDDIFGDGVNIAARLQALADAGGVAISADVHRQVEAKLALHYQDMGERTVKAGDLPIRAYRVMGPQQATAPEAHAGRSGWTPRRWAFVAAGLIILVAGAAVGSRMLDQFGATAEAECVDHLGLPIPARECEAKGN